LSKKIFVQPLFGRVQASDQSRFAFHAFERPTYMYNEAMTLACKRNIDSSRAVGLYYGIGY